LTFHHKGWGLSDYVVEIEMENLKGTAELAKSFADEFGRV